MIVTWVPWDVLSDAGLRPQPIAEHPAGHPCDERGRAGERWWGVTVEEFVKKYQRFLRPTGPRQQIIGRNGLRYRVVKGKLVRIAEQAAGGSEK